MDKSDQTAIYEVMEQQTISISKQALWWHSMCACQSKLWPTRCMAITTPRYLPWRPSICQQLCLYVALTCLHAMITVTSNWHNILPTSTCIASTKTLNTSNLIWPLCGKESLYFYTIATSTYWTNFPWQHLHCTHPTMSPRHPTRCAVLHRQHIHAPTFVGIKPFLWFPPMIGTSLRLWQWRQVIQRGTHSHMLRAKKRDMWNLMVEVETGY